MSIYVGVGGWVYEPWRNNFYPFAATGYKPGQIDPGIDLSSGRAELGRGARL